MLWRRSKSTNANNQVYLHGKFATNCSQIISAHRTPFQVYVLNALYKLFL
ncbi:unnamed protein product [Angiostrongylus costaricensis]|uniref:Uncharacterized protein n=1 Tax=Angiostrongylus costaricensis TaxID=334426 RepID=A0A0R3PD20_ANGCS|nr:unnamed protein product [Angiostrongylus costaricensis]